MPTDIASPSILSLKHLLKGKGGAVECRSSPHLACVPSSLCPMLLAVYAICYMGLYVIWVSLSASPSCSLCCHAALACAAKCKGVGARSRGCRTAGRARAHSQLCPRAVRTTTRRRTATTGSSSWSMSSSTSCAPCRHPAHCLPRRTWHCHTGLPRVPTVCCELIHRCQMRVSQPHLLQTCV